MGFHWEIGATDVEWRLIDSDLIDLLRNIAKRSSRSFQKGPVCLSGAKNWIWSLDFDTSCHHRSARLLAGDISNFSNVLCCGVSPMLHSALGKYTLKYTLEKTPLKIHFGKIHLGTKF